MIDGDSKRRQASDTDNFIWPRSGDVIFITTQCAASQVIHVRRDLDIGTSGALGVTIANAASIVRGPIVVSLEHCRYCDASGVRALLLAKAALGERLRIVVPLAGMVRRVFDVTGLADRLGLHDTLERAVGSAETASA